jgi:hypothetical protein
MIRYKDHRIPNGRTQLLNCLRVDESSKVWAWAESGTNKNPLVVSKGSTWYVGRLDFWRGHYPVVADLLHDFLNVEHESQQQAFVRIEDGGYATDLESFEIHKLQLVYNTNGKNIVLVSGIGSPFSGYQYILFDELDNKWISFHNWGTPQVLDINDDSINEVLLQFHGMHLNTPDLYIFSFQNGRLMIADVNFGVYRNAKLDESKSKIASAYIKGQDGNVLVEISDLMGNGASVLYHLEYDELNSTVLRLIRET